MTKKKEKEFLVVEDIMEMFGVTQRTVYRWAASGKLPGARLGKRWHFERAEVMNLIKKGGF